MVYFTVIQEVGMSFQEWYLTSQLKSLIELYVKSEHS